MSDALAVVQKLYECFGKGDIPGVLSLLACVVSMFALFAGWTKGGQWSFVIALILMIVSMLISLRELTVSVVALDLLLMELEKEEKKG